MADSEFAQALALRLLHVPKEAPICEKCGQISGFKHIEACRVAEKGTIYRHDIIRTAIAKAYKSIPGTKVAEEIEVEGGLRTDIRVTNQQANIQHYDVTIVSINTLANQERPPQEVLTSIALEKKAKYKQLGR